MGKLKPYAAFVVATIVAGCDAQSMPSDATTPATVAGECQQPKITCLRQTINAALPILWQEGDRYRVGMMRFSGVGPDGAAHYTLRGIVSYPVPEPAIAALSHVRETIEDGAR